MKNFIKTAFAALLGLSLLMVSACSDSQTNNSNGTSSADSQTLTDTSVFSAQAGDITSKAEESKTQKPVTDFTTYVSNTVVSTGNNFYIEKADGIRYRAYLPVEEYGELEYKFYFTNKVDSTYSKGKIAYVGKDGGTYTVSDAVIADGGTGPEDEITNRTAVTFGGSNSKGVTPNESYWSDTVSFNVPEGHYLVWEWTISGEGIPCNKMATLTSTASSEDGENFGYCDEIPLPQIIGAKRDVKHTVAAIGDSITQGCQTEYMKYEYWAAKISAKLGSDVSFFNCGLGWASDAAANENWLSRVSEYDTVIVAFGTNDISSGNYGGKKNTAEEIEGYITEIVSYLREKGCRVILFNAPPQNFGETNENVRSTLNEKLVDTAKNLAAEFFDFASLLSTEEAPAEAVYGGHPNGEGGTVVADAFVKQFGCLFE